MCMKKNDICDCEVIHSDVVEKVKQTFPADEVIDLVKFSV